MTDIVVEDENVTESIDEQLSPDDDSAVKGPKKPTITFTRDRLKDMRDLPFCRTLPDCLNKDYINVETGRWDPERWFNDINGLPNDSESRNSNLNGGKKVVDYQDKNGGYKKRSSLGVDGRERQQDESLDIILCPQRRTFNTGCHVSSNSGSSFGVGKVAPYDVGSGNRIPPRSFDSHHSYGDKRDDHLSRQDSGDRMHNIGMNRRIGSGRIIPHRNEKPLDWSKAREYYSGPSRDHEIDGHDQRRNSRYSSGGGRYGEHNERDNRTRTNYNHNHHSEQRGRSFSDVRHRDYERSTEEEEPEWFTGGPTSQHDTIELKGFEEDSAIVVAQEDYSQSDQSNPSPSSKLLNSLSSSVKTESSKERNGEQVNVDIASSIADRLRDSSASDSASSKKSEEFDLNNILGSEQWQNMAKADPAVVNGFTSANGDVNSSRFARWFANSSSERESPVDKLFSKMTYKPEHSSQQHQQLISTPQEQLTGVNSQASSIYNMLNKNRSNEVADVMAFKHQNETEKSIMSMLQRSQKAGLIPTQALVNATRQDGHCINQRIQSGADQMRASQVSGPVSQIPQAMDASEASKFQQWFNNQTEHGRDSPIDRLLAKFKASNVAGMKPMPPQVQQQMPPLMQQFASRPHPQAPVLNRPLFFQLVNNGVNPEMDHIDPLLSHQQQLRGQALMAAMRPQRPMMNSLQGMVAVNAHRPSQQPPSNLPHFQGFPNAEMNGHMFIRPPPNHPPMQADPNGQIKMFLQSQMVEQHQQFTSTLPLNFDRTQVKTAEEIEADLLSVDRSRPSEPTGGIRTVNQLIKQLAISRSGLTTGGAGQQK